MNRNIKTITKILIITLISIAVLLILPKYVNAEDVYLYPVNYRRRRNISI